MTVAATDDVTAELRELTERRRRLAEHQEQVQEGFRRAHRELQDAKTELGRVEADAAAGDVTAKQRTQVECRVTAAQVKVAEPWEQRLDGAKAALRDADRDIQAFAADNIDELIAIAEDACEPHVARLNALAVELDQAIIEVSQASGGITQMLALAAITPRPNAVTRMHTDELRAALSRFTGAGGQPPIALDRRYVPALAEADRLAEAVS